MNCHSVGRSLPERAAETPQNHAHISSHYANFCTSPKNIYISSGGNSSEKIIVLEALKTPAFLSQCTDAHLQYQTLVARHCMLPASHFPFLELRPALKDSPSRRCVLTGPGWEWALRRHRSPRGRWARGRCQPWWLHRPCRSHGQRGPQDGERLGPGVARTLRSVQARLASDPNSTSPPAARLCRVCVRRHTSLRGTVSGQLWAVTREGSASGRPRQDRQTPRCFLPGSAGPGGDPTRLSWAQQPCLPGPPAPSPWSSASARLPCPGG